MQTSAEIPVTTGQAGQPLAGNSVFDLHHENDALKKRVKQLEDELSQHRQSIEALQATNERLLYKLSRSLFSADEYDQFDPSEYTVPVEAMLANAKQRLQKQ